MSKTNLQEPMVEKSYATFGFTRSLRQIQHAFNERKNAEAGMFMLLDMVKEQEKQIVEGIGRPIENMRILELGPGQGLERARYFGRKNEVIGIDLDVIPVGLDLGSYVQMMKKNGLGRVAKSIGRRVIFGRANETA